MDSNESLETGITLFTTILDILGFEIGPISLEQRQNKNDSIQSKIIPILKFPPFSLTV